LERPVKDRRAHVKPAGSYLIGARRLEINPEMSPDQAERQIFQAYDDLKARAAASGLEIIGDVYETELSVYTGSIYGAMRAELQVQIAPGPPR
jgi:hypothetical protein